MTKKLLSGITTFMLGVIMTGSVVMAGTAALTRSTQAGFYNFYLETDASTGYEQDTWDVITCRQKNTTSDLRVIFDGGTGAYDVTAIGSHSAGLTFTNFADCSDGHVYRMTVGDECDIFNRVNEWGYPYAGIKGVPVGDGHYYVTGIFWPDI